MLRTYQKQSKSIPFLKYTIPLPQTKPTKLLVKVTIQGREIKIVLATETTVADLVAAVLSKYISDCYVPLLSTIDPACYDLHYSPFDLECLGRERKLIELESRSFYLYRREKKAAEEGRNCRGGGGLNWWWKVFDWCLTWSVKSVWHSFNDLLLLKRLKSLSFADLWFLLSKSISKHSISVFCVVLWGIWNFRNALLHDSHHRPLHSIFSWAVNWPLEFQSSKAVISIPSPASPSLPTQWIPPPSGVLKLNSDAAIGKDGSSTGFGIVIRNHEGFVVASASKFMPGSFSAEIGELLALREGLLLAYHFGLSVGLAEVDASNVVLNLNSCIPNLGDSGLILDDIRALCMEAGPCSCSVISRLANGTAHGLASLALSLKKECRWHFVTVDCVSSLCPS